MAYAIHVFLQSLDIAANEQRVVGVQNLIQLPRGCVVRSLLEELALCIVDENRHQDAEQERRQGTALQNAKLLGVSARCFPTVPNCEATIAIDPLHH